MTIEQFKLWAKFQDEITDKAYEFFDTIRKNYPLVLSDFPARCFYDGIETSDTVDIQLLVKYTITDDVSRSFRLFKKDIERLLKSPAEAAKEYAKEVMAIQERERIKKLQQKNDAQKEKDLEEYERIKAKYNL